MSAPLKLHLLRDAWSISAAPLGFEPDNLPATANLPATRAGLWEHWLGEPGRPPDVALRVAADEWESPAGRAIRASADRDASESGRRFARFLDEASRGGGPWGEGPAEVWLEFDHADAGSVAPPNVFWKIPSDRARPPFAGDPRRDAVERFVASTSEIAAILGRSFDGAALARVAESVPPPAGFSYVGAMLQRDGAGLRLTIGDFPLHGVGGFLAQAGWPGELAPWLSTLDRLRRLDAAAALHLDVADGLGPTLGLELSPARRADAPSDWGPILSFLAEAGLASADDLALARRWPGVATRHANAAAWPAALRGNVATRSLNHAKLVFSGGSTAPLTRAKLYLGHEFAARFPGPSLW